MPDHCVVPFCGNKGGHVFPINKMLRKKWICAVRRKNWEPTRWSRVCHKHFTDDDLIACNTSQSFYVVPRRRLKPDAVPSVFRWTMFSQSSHTEKHSPESSERAEKKIVTTQLSESFTDSIHHEMSVTDCKDMTDQMDHSGLNKTKIITQRSLGDTHYKAHTYDHHMKCLQNICRTCGRRTQTNYDRLKRKCINSDTCSKYAEKIFSCFDLDVKDDLLTKHSPKICSRCISRVCNNAKRRSEKSIQAGRQILDSRRHIWCEFNPALNVMECGVCFHFLLSSVGCRIGKLKSLVPDISASPNQPCGFSDEFIIEYEIETTDENTAHMVPESTAQVRNTATLGNLEFFDSDANMFLKHPCNVSEDSVSHEEFDITTRTMQMINTKTSEKATFVCELSGSASQTCSVNADLISQDGVGVTNKITIQKPTKLTAHFMSLPVSKEEVCNTPVETNSTFHHSDKPPTYPQTTEEMQNFKIIKDTNSVLDISSSENCLGFLATRFISLLLESKDGVLNLKTASEGLPVPLKYRLTNIIRVLEGLGLVEVKARGGIHWRDPELNKIPRDIFERLTSLRKDVADLTEQENEIDKHTQYIQQSIMESTEEIANSRLAFVTHEDICHCFDGDKLLVVDAPEETSLEMPVPETGSEFNKLYQIHLNSQSGPINVLLVNKDTDESEPVVVQVPPSLQKEAFSKSTNQHGTQSLNCSQEYQEKKMRGRSTNT